jgi:hypothetical protein
MAISAAIKARAVVAAYSVMVIGPAPIDLISSSRSSSRTQRYARVSLAILARDRAYSATQADSSRLEKSSASALSRMRGCVAFGSNAVLTFPFLSGLRYFSFFGKHAGRRGRKGIGLLD